MLEIFWKKNLSWNFLVVRIKKKELGIRFRRFWDEFFFICRKYCQKFFLPKFHFSWVTEGLCLPTGAVLLDPACYWIEDSSRNRYALNVILAKISTILFSQEFFLSENRLKRMLKFLFQILTRKKCEKKYIFDEIFRTFFQKFFY